MAKAPSRKHTVTYSQRLGLHGTPTNPVLLRRNNDALIVDVECGRKHILRVTITGGGQLHIEDGNGRKHLSALEFVGENKKIKGHPY
jgi:hypothetical protein